MPDTARFLVKYEPMGFKVTFAVIQAELHTLGLRRPYGKVDSIADKGRAQFGRISSFEMSDMAGHRGSP
jgi:hypothetical protein